MGLTTMASGTWAFCAFCTTVDIPETSQSNIFLTHIIPNEDDGSSFQPKDPVEPLPQDNYQENPQDNVMLEDQEPMSRNLYDKLLRWHYRLGHLPFNCIKQLAEQGQRPKRLLACKKPFCATCQYGKMTK